MSLLRSMAIEGIKREHMPAALAPNQELNLTHIVTDNGVVAVGGLSIETTTAELRLNTGLSGAGAFTASGTKASKIAAFSYSRRVG